MMCGLGISLCTDWLIGEIMYVLGGERFRILQSSLELRSEYPKMHLSVFTCTFVLTMKQYEALEETAHLLSTQANTEHLMESIAQHKAGRVLIKKLVEPKRAMITAKK